MNTEQQDKLWNELSEESKNKVQQDYKTLQMGLSTGLLEDEYLAEQIGKIKELENLFGTHNLNPKPQIKTWEDVEKENPKYFKKQNAPNPMLLSTNELRDKLAKKVLAMYKIAILIESGYGGMVSEEEWKDEKLSKYYIEFVEEPSINCSRNDYRQFISFHSRELAEEFMSYESNRKLVEQYYMI